MVSGIFPVAAAHIWRYTAHVKTLLFSAAAQPSHRVCLIKLRGRSCSIWIFPCLDDMTLLSASTYYMHGPVRTLMTLSQLRASWWLVTFIHLSSEEHCQLQFTAIYRQNLLICPMLYTTDVYHNTAVGHFLSPVLPSGIRFRTSSEIKAVQKALSNSRWRHIF